MSNDIREHRKRLHAELIACQDRIIREARVLVALSDVRAGRDAIEHQIGFMDTLQAHRRGVLSEYSRAGGHVVDVYNSGAYAEDVEDGAALGEAGAARDTKG